jgi:orotidine-5'-phosphate decarboxylase
MLQVDRLYEAVAEKSPVCVGLDTDFSYIPAECVDKTLSKGENIFRFNRDIIEATRSVAGCFKVQIAYYERWAWTACWPINPRWNTCAGRACGHRGHQARRHCQNGRDVCQGHLDGEFEAGLRYAGAYMGLDSITPYTKYMTEKGKGVFVLCRTSNPGAKDYEYEKLADGRHVYDLVGDKLSAMGKAYMGAHGYSSLGLVIGGTHIEEAKEIRAKYRDSFFLIPGYGAQGGTAEDIAQYLAQGNGGVVNSSRSVLLAYKKQPGTAYAEAAYNECVHMKEAIADACSKL